MHIGEILGWFFFTILKFAFSPSMMVGAGYPFWEAWILTSMSAIIGVTVFFYFGSAIFKWIDSLRKTKKRVVTPKSRRLVKFLHAYGLVGLALFSLFLSIPIAGLVAAKFFHNKPKVVLLVLYTAFTSWSLILTSLSVFLGISFGG